MDLRHKEIENHLIWHLRKPGDDGLLYFTMLYIISMKSANRVALYSTLPKAW